MFTIDLQCRRLHSSEPEDKEFVFRKWADFDFLVVALFRLRRAAKLASGIPEIQDIMIAALKRFDGALPGLGKFRNVAEHIDDYALDRGRDASVGRDMLEVSSLGDDGSTLEWLGETLNTANALRASSRLFADIKRAGSAFKTRR